MTEIVNTATIKVVADGSGVEAGLRPVDDAVARTGKNLDNLGATAKKTAKDMEAIGQAPGFAPAGDGAGAAAAKIERATKSMADAIQRTTAAMEAGSKGSADYYRSLAGQRGIDVNALQPFLAQLDAATAKAEAAAAAQKKLDESTRFLSELRTRADGIGKTAADLAEMQAAQMGVSESAAPMIARMREAERGTSGLASMVTRAKEALIGLAAGMSIATFVHQAIEAQREFDKLNSSLITATGSVGGAEQAFEALQKFAASTPYSVKEATEAFIQMKNLGLDPSEHALRSYGNTASAMGKSLNQMVEAVADAATGEFERLKEFGIKAKQNGDQVSFTFQGVTKTIGNSAEEIESYLQRIGDTAFAGGMELRAKTLDGAISNLGDSWESFLRKVAQSGLGDTTRTAVLGLSGAIDSLSSSVELLSSTLVASAKIATAYIGTFVVAPAVFQSAATAIGVLQVQLALARMEMAGGARISTLLTTSLGGLSVSAYLASGALGALKVAGGVLFAAFAGWEIGKWLNDNFVEARVAGYVFVEAMLVGWEHLKYGALMAWEGISFGWDKTVSTMKGAFADFLEKTAKGLSFVGASATSKDVTAYVEQLRKAADAQGTFASRTAAMTTAHEASLASINKNISELIQYEFVADRVSQATSGGLARYKTEVSAAEKAAQAANDLIEVRMRQAGVDKQYFEDLKKLQEARETGAISEKEYVAMVSKLATETYKKSEAGKSATDAAKKEGDAYRDLIGAISTKITETQRELEAGLGLTDSQKLQIKFDQELTSGKLKLSDSHKKAVQAKLDDLSASEQLLKADQAQRDVTKYINESAQARQQQNATLAVEYNLYGQSADARAIAMAAVEAQTWKEKELAKLREEKKPISDAIIAQLDKEATARAKVAQETLGQTKALGYATQLEDENKKFNIQYIADDRQRAAAQLALEREVWEERVKLAGDGTEAQKILQQNFDTWYQNQSQKPYLDEQKKAWASIEWTAHDTFVSIFDSGKSAFDRLRDTLKNGLLDLLYQMSIKQWVINIGAAVTGGGASGLASAAGAPAGSSLGSAGGSLLGSAAGSLFGAGGLSGSLMAGAGWLTGSTTLTGALSAAGSLIGTGSAAGIMSGIGMAAGALGPIALGVAGILSVVNKLDNSGTPHTGGASSASAAGVKNIDAGTLGFQRIDTSDAAQQLTSQLASSVVAILDSTATTFGKTAGYTAATAFADDSSKDGAWGALIISNLNGMVSQWGDANSRWAPSVFADGDAGQQQYLDAISGSVRSALDGIGLPSWAKAMLDSLGDAPALEDLAKTVDTINATQKALATMGERLVGFSALSDDAVSALLSASGGIDTLAANASAYYDAFYGESEKTKVLTDQVTEALKKVGLALPETREAYRAQVEAQLALGTVGAPAAAALLGVAAAIDQLYPAAESSSNSLQQIADERKNLQDQLDELTMTSTQLRAKERAAIDDSNKALYDQIQALKDQAKAVEDQKAAIEAAKSAATTLLGGVDGAYSVLQKVVAREKNVLQERIDKETEAVNRLKSLSDSIHSTLDSMKVPGTELFSRQAAQAQIRDALSAVRGGAQLSDDQIKSLGQAFGTVSQDSAKLFASKDDYLFDLLTTRNDIAQLGNITDDQLTNEEKSLKELQNQSQALDATLEKYQEQIDILKGIDTKGLTLIEAINGLAGAIASARQNSVVSSASAINGAYQQYLGRAPDQAGFEWWQNAAAGGTPTSQIVDGIKNSTEANLKNLYESVLGRAPDAEGLAFWMNAYGPTMSEAEKADFLKGAKAELDAKAAGKQDDWLKSHGVPGYASGGMFGGGLRIVGENGPELEATGPSRIWSSNQTAALLSRAANPSENSAALAETVRTLNATVATLKEANADMARDMKTMAQALKDASPNGQFLRVKVVNN